MEKESKDIFFVEVREPDEVRRNILESLKEIVESLQRFEKFKEIRKEKSGNVDKLKKDVKEINKIILNLKSALPESKLRAMEVSKPVAEKKGKKKKHKKKHKEAEERKPASELEKLESELSAIESKLGSLR